MGKKKENIGPGMKTSPWIILGATAILVVVVLALAFQNVQREKRHMTQVLSAKGAALIRAVEAGTRTGMMGGSMWGVRQVQRMMEETSQLPDVRYMAVIGSQGKVLAHSDADLIGQPLRPNRPIVHLGPQMQENYELVTLADGQRVFEVHRYFRPLPRGGRHFHDDAHRGGRMMGRFGGRSTASGDEDWLDPQKQHTLLIVAGLDTGPFEKSIQSSLRNTVLLSVLLLLLGFAGFVALFWMHSYRIASRSLQDTSAFAHEVVAHLPVGLIATDQQGGIAFFNAAAEKITGVPRSQALGVNPEQILPSGLCDLKSVMDLGHTIREKEMPCAFGDGSAVWVSVSGTRIVNELDQVVGHVVILRDLEEVRRLQEEIRRQEKLAALGGMAAGVAHEIRNPLSSIKGMATYLAGRFGPNSEDRNAAQVMIQEVDRLNRVITALLDFARPSDINPRPTDFAQLLKHSLKLIQVDAAAKNIRIQLDVDGCVCRPLLDPDRISQCLLNLYLNAIQAMPQGGELVVRCRPDSPEGVQLEISDTGQGISKEHLSQIFNPYFTTKPTGTGLGLAIVHKIVEGHSGHISARSNPGEGATFTLHLPCAPNGEHGEGDEHTN